MDEVGEQKVSETNREWCNKHANCAAADADARLHGRVYPIHCYDENCEDCFGS